MPGARMTWALDAPVHVVIGMERSFVTHRLAASVSGVDYPWVDIGIAGEHLVLAATELGLGTCWIGWIKPRVVRKLLGWPAAVKPVVVITVGYPRTPAAAMNGVFSNTARTSFGPDIGSEAVRTIPFKSPSHRRF